MIPHKTNASDENAASMGCFSAQVAVPKA
ncbi:cytidine deaminase [Vibrio alginolyticus 12G01]|nr:cytidine deaminase [Vibrio alginolyticus 12G01]